MRELCILEFREEEKHYELLYYNKNYKNKDILFNINDIQENENKNDLINGAKEDNDNKYILKKEIKLDNENKHYTANIQNNKIEKAIDLTE